MYTALKSLDVGWNTFFFSLQIAFYCYYRFCPLSGIEKTHWKHWMASVLLRCDAPHQCTLQTPASHCHEKLNLPECTDGCGAVWLGCAGCSLPPASCGGTATSWVRVLAGRSLLAIAAADVGWTQHYLYDSVHFCCQKDITSLLKELFLKCGM